MNERLMLIIKMSKLTQKEFAEKIHVYPIRISKWKKNIERPNVDALLNIHNEFNVNINWLLTGKGEMLITDQRKTIDCYPDEKRKFFKEPCMLVLSTMIEKLDTEKRKKLIHLISVCFDQEIIECKTNEKPKEIKV